MGTKTAALDKLADALAGADLCYKPVDDPDFKYNGNP